MYYTEDPKCSSPGHLYQGSQETCGWVLLVSLLPLKGPTLGPTTKTWFRPVFLCLVFSLEPPSYSTLSTLHPTHVWHHYHLTKSFKPKETQTAQKCINQPLMSKRGMDAEHRRCGRVSAPTPEMREMNTNWTFPTGHTSLGGQGKTQIWTFIKGFGTGNSLIIPIPTLLSASERKLGKH